MDEGKNEIRYRKNNFLSEGYGILPKLVMRDKKLPIEAKAIYAYLVAFAGNKYTCYPSRDLMCKELNIGKNRFTKYLDLLKESGYIKVTNTQNGKFKIKNIYEIIMDERDRQEILRCLQFRDTEARDTEIRDLETKTLIVTV